MFIIQTSTSTRQKVLVERVVDVDFKTIKKGGRFKFDWNKQSDTEVYKLRLKDANISLGLLSITIHENEKWIEINLLESSSENIGKQKEYGNIAGVLIAFVCKLAFELGFDGTVALTPKTNLVELYMNNYGFLPSGRRLYTDLYNSKKLIDKYLSDEK